MITYGRLVLDGVCLRRTVAGRHTLSYPTSTDRHGKRHRYVFPTDDAARQEIEREILRQLREHEVFVP